ncbi:type I-E CRISPR-associated protein Cas7/Cse4/CasC [Methanocella sp. CWC-04]|uniref:Type I-E CRISPR-associated protein Cas7/Cse4/CasC n=1 Tax=Methanooceanicella nereidis TaxID=2052831 RepID=A0AAP2W771_9EURY|nr:type I-E CRISPR-associated protein Cas7/Cse4/CasC [Methanocella sp. CWC-04]MCD1294791.1 type I-E CRISPR-associated protein Cas7/Cse4/CasC [Methanocella sp. CWC-04]
MKLIEIHMIQNHAPCNLNRDDTGSPKDCMFGGIRRSRISSQSIKRSIRASEIFQEEMKDIGLAMRTRRLPELVKQKLLSEGIDEKMANMAAEKATGFGTKDGKEREGELNTAQTMFITQKDIDAVAEVMKDAIKTSDSVEEFKKIKAADLQKKAELKGWRPITPDIALFGRMTTSDAFMNVEASMQVAHALSTNKMDHEFDYFTAVDDLQKNNNEDTGADMIGDVQFNSACYYKYFSLDYESFVENLAGIKPGEKSDEAEKKAYEEALENAKKIASVTISAFIKAAIYTTPSGKQNSFAAHQLPSMILVEIRPKKTPVSFANAFIRPAKPSNSVDLIEDSINKFINEVELQTAKFNLESTKRLLFTTGNKRINGADECPSIDDLISSIKKAF